MALLLARHLAEQDAAVFSGPQGILEMAKLTQASHLCVAPKVPGKYRRIKSWPGLPIF